MARRKWLVPTIGLWMITTGATGFADTSASSVPDHIRLTWSEDPKTTQTISWRTDTSVPNGKVEFAVSGRSVSVVSAPAPETLTTPIGAIHLFSAVLRGLQPGTKYRYRVGDSTQWSPYYTFETEKIDTDRFEFLVFGDSHEKKPVYTVWQQTVNQAYRQNPGARFMMNVGDLIYSGKDYEQWQSWFAAGREVIASIPAMPVIGDHEPRGVTSKEQWQRPEYFVKFFPVPRNGPGDFKGEVYSFDYGPAHIAVLNSSFHYEFSDPAARQAMIRAQVEWLDADLAATRKPWKIVVYHDATYNLAADRAGTLTRLHFGPVIDRHHVDVVFNAHDHALARSFFIKNEEFVPSAAEGTLYYVSGRAGDNAKDSLGRKIWHPFFYDPQGQTCYLLVEVDSGRMVIKARLQDGTLIDQLIINKRKPEESTPVVPFGAYQGVRMAVFGYLLPFGKPPRQNEKGEWFVDIQALAACMSGRFDPTTLIFQYDGGEIQLPLKEAMFIDQREMVSLAGLQSVGFYGKYFKSMNLVMVERWRD